MIIYQDKNNKIVYEGGEIRGYVKKIFGNTWELAKVYVEGITPAQARQCKKMIKENNNK